MLPKLLLDAHVSRPMLEYLSGLGYDCLHMAMLEAGMSDEQVLSLAHRERRVVVTFDKDFGDLLVRRRLPAVGVVLLRLGGTTESDRLETFRELWPHAAAAAVGSFVTVTRRQIRRRALQVD